MSNVPSNRSLTLIESFKAFYRDIGLIRLDDMERLYDTDVVFKDPVHEIRGINTLHAYMSDVCSNVNAGRFEYLDQLIGDNRAYIKWNMYFSHRRLGPKTIVVRGMSQMDFTDKIHYHEDVYDMGELLYEHLPLVGGATRWLKHRLSCATRKN